MSKMTIGEAICQLEDLRIDREAFADLDEPDNIFVQDMNAIDVAIKHLRSLPRWIPCSERMPEKDGRYLCVWLNNSVATFWFSNKHFRLCGEIDHLVTHWMPMPDPPETEDENEAERVD